MSKVIMNKFLSFLFGESTSSGRKPLLSGNRPEILAYSVYAVDTSLLVGTNIPSSPQNTLKIRDRT